MFVDFGAAHSLSFRSDEGIRTGHLMWRDLNLCNDAGINIDALDQPWLAKIDSPLADQGMMFSVYEMKTGSGWEPLAADLLDKIARAWPGKITFSGPDGKTISIDEALKGRQ
jgi:hypothetical protein